MIRISFDSRSEADEFCDMLPPLSLERLIQSAMKKAGKLLRVRDYEDHDLEGWGHRIRVALSDARRGLNDNGVLTGLPTTAEADHLRDIGELPTALSGLRIESESMWHDGHVRLEIWDRGKRLGSVFYSPKLAQKRQNGQKIEAIRNVVLRDAPADIAKRIDEIIDCPRCDHDICSAHQRIEVIGRLLGGTPIRTSLQDALSSVLKGPGAASLVFHRRNAASIGVILQFDGAGICEFTLSPGQLRGFCDVGYEMAHASDGVPTPAQMIAELEAQVGE